MIQTDRHYVTLGKERFRNFHVVQCQAVAPRPGGRLTLRYVTISRHWTWKAANKAAARLNRGPA